MKLRKLGRNGPEVSEIGFGAWAIGGGQWGGARDQDAGAALLRAREHGVNFIDTALVYGEGHSERLVGAFVREHRWHDAIIASKVPPKPMDWPARPDAQLEDFFPNDWIRGSCEQSLKNLGRE